MVSFGITSVAMGDPVYTFTSGFNGDGFSWPASPTGLLDDDSFQTPDYVLFYNDTGNNVFFDSQYPVIDDAAGFSEDALWGNPTEQYGQVYIDLYNAGEGGVDTVAFDFAWSSSSVPSPALQIVTIIIEDSSGRATSQTFPLSHAFTGFGGTDGYSGHIFIDYTTLTDTYEEEDGGPFEDIANVTVYLDDIVTGGPSSEFGIDNFELNATFGGGGELYPSVDNGQIDISNGGLLRIILRGTGIFGLNFEVTNGGSATTYSTQLQPGGELIDLGQVNSAPIGAGQILNTPNILAVNRASASGEYGTTVVLINDGDPGDPDNNVSLYARLMEPPSLSAPSPVNVTAAQPVSLSNAAEPANGFRASVKVTSTSVSGPFAVSGFANGTAVKNGATLNGTPAFDRYGRLSGSHSGTFTASLQMAAFAGINNDIEVLLFGAEAVPNVQWTLQATLADNLTDNAAYTNGQALGPANVGVNTAAIAGTIVAGTATATGNVALTIASGQEGTNTSVIGQAVDEDLSTAVPVHVVQLTYRDAGLCANIVENNLRLLHFNTGTSNWQLAVTANTGGTPSFVSGSWTSFAATLGSSPLSTALGKHGLDTANNQVWAVVNHEGKFGVGELGKFCRIPGDWNLDGDVDSADVAEFIACGTRSLVPRTLACAPKDFNSDNDVDMNDFGVMQRCYSGADQPGNPHCAD